MNRTYVAFVLCGVNRIARRAVQALKESRAQMRRAGTGVNEPTWTGLSGSAGLADPTGTRV